MKKTQLVQTLVRVPHVMRRYLELEAKRQRRSLSSEILIRLETTIPNKSKMKINEEQDESM